MALFSEVKAAGITIRESANDGSDFTNPDADYRRLFLGEDGFLHAKDSAGSVTDPYDTSGTGTNLNPGTSFPGGPAAGDLCWRTDRSLLYFYNGTRWLTVQQYSFDFSLYDNSGSVPFGTNSTVMYASMIGVDYDVWLEKWYATSVVVTTNTGSAYWTMTLADAGANTIGSYNTSADSPNVKTNHEQTIGALHGTTSPDDLWVQITHAKTGSPGTIYSINRLVGRLVG